MEEGATPPQATRPAGPVSGGPPGTPPSHFKYGPGVAAAPPAGPTGGTAEQVWRAGRPPEPTRRPLRLRRLAGSALTVALLAASGVVLFMRFHHAPFQVTGVAISAVKPVRCGVDVTGQITTNGAAGTVNFRWLFQPGPQPPQPGRQSLVAGQGAVYVIEPIEASGPGQKLEKVTLQVTGPGTRSVSTTVRLSC